MPLPSITRLTPEHRAALLDPERTPGLRVPCALRYAQTADLVDDNVVRVEGQCVVTRKLHRALYPVDGLATWLNTRMNIQEAMPDVCAPDREFLMTGISPEGWRATLDDEDDEDVDDGDYIAERVAARDDGPPNPDADERDGVLGFIDGDPDDLNGEDGD